MKKILFTVMALTLAALFAFTPAMGETAPEGTYQAIGAFHEGLAAVQTADGLWGYIDTTGAVVIPCEWEEAGDFSFGVARVRKDRLYGYIDASGKQVIPCEWGYATEIARDGMLCVGEAIYAHSFQIMNVKGEIVGSDWWEQTFPPYFSEGLAAVSKDNLDGYIDTTGELVIPCQFRLGNAFHHGYAIVYGDDGLLFFIDKTGAPAFPDLPHANQADAFREDGIGFLRFPDGTSAYINTDGEIICSLPEGYYSRAGFSEGLSGVGTVNEDGEYVDAYMNTSGEIVISGLECAQFRFHNGRVPIMNENWKYGVMDTTGTVVYPCELDEEAEFEETVARAVKDGKEAVMDLNGNLVIPFEEGCTSIAIGEGIITAIKNGEITLFDYEGNLLK